MPTDYDTARMRDDGLVEGVVEELKTHRTHAPIGLTELDEVDNEPIELPGADLSGEELTVQVLPKQDDEFTCLGCFLVLHRSRLTRQTNSESLCADCA